MQSTSVWARETDVADESWRLTSPALNNLRAQGAAFRAQMAASRAQDAAEAASGMPHTPAQGATHRANYSAAYNQTTVRCDCGWSDTAPSGLVAMRALETAHGEHLTEVFMRGARPAPQPTADAPGTVQESTDRGTGEPGLQISTQTLEGEPLTGPEIISRTLVLAFGTRHHDRAFIKEIAEALDAALRPIHEAATPDVDGWTLHARPGGLQVSHDTDADMPVLLHDQHLPLGAVLAFIADHDEEAGR